MILALSEVRQAVIYNGKSHSERFYCQQKFNMIKLERVGELDIASEIHVAH